MREYFPRGELEALASQYGTDKASYHHDYMRFYEFFLRPFKNDEFTLLELGVGPEKSKGKSLLTWRDYFPRAQIVGVDRRADARDVATDRIAIEIGDCGNERFLAGLAKKYSPAIIVEDASHKWSHQIKSLTTLFPSLQPGGIFIVEDIHTSFGKWGERGFSDQADDTASYLTHLTHLVTGKGHPHPLTANREVGKIEGKLRSQIDAISFYDSTCLLVKKTPKEIPPAPPA
jgi:hypothetical protein